MCTSSQTQSLFATLGLRLMDRIVCAKIIDISVESSVIVSSLSIILSIVSGTNV